MKKHWGFTLIEMMVVVVIMAILASMAVPSYLGGVVKDQIDEANPLIEIAKTPLALSWQINHGFPANNQDAGLPAANKMVNNYVSSVEVRNGVINITFGNRANGILKGNILSIRPAVVMDAPIVPVTWICAGAAVPDNMTVIGEDKTTVPVKYLPLICR